MLFFYRFYNKLFKLNFLFVGLDVFKVRKDVCLECDIVNKLFKLKGSYFV